MNNPTMNEQAAQCAPSPTVPSTKEGLAYLIAEYLLGQGFIGVDQFEAAYNDAEGYIEFVTGRCLEAAV